MAVSRDQKDSLSSPGGQKATPPSGFWGSKEKEQKGIPRSEVEWKLKQHSGKIPDSGLNTDYLSREKRAGIAKKIPGHFGPWISKKDMESYIKEYDKKIYEAKTGAEKSALRHERDTLKDIIK